MLEGHSWASAYMAYQNQDKEYLIIIGIRFSKILHWDRKLAFQTGLVPVEAVLGLPCNYFVNRGSYMSAHV